jgi:tRNA(adenine34) deaminase
MKEQRGFRSFMEDALNEAREAFARGEVPVGAVVVFEGQVVARAGNRTRELHDPTAHAEMLEPCPMCAAALSAARIARLYYGASDPKSGGVGQGPRIFSHPQCHHVPEVYDGIAAGPSEALLRDFFALRR